MATFGRSLALALLLGCMSTGSAWADEAPPPVSGPSIVERDAGWRYDTDYFFGLTRGLPESGLRPRCRPYVVPFTIVLDLVTLPGAALSGLFG